MDREIHPCSFTSGAGLGLVDFQGKGNGAGSDPYNIDSSYIYWGCTAISIVKLG